MRFKHILGLLCAASISVALAGTASAQEKTVKIGAIYPLSGNAASAGVHAKAAIETAEANPESLMPNTFGFGIELRPVVPPVSDCHSIATFSTIIPKAIVTTAR